MATLTLTYDDPNGRVVCTATSLSASATVAMFEVSYDNIHWQQVRGGAAVPIASNAASIYDYEFTPGFPNYYRVSAVNTAAPTFVASTSAVTAVGITVTPTLPTYAEGDLLVIWATIRNSGTGRVVCPTGYSVMLQIDNIGLFGKRAGAAGSETNPTVTVTGGVTGTSGSDVIAQMATFRNNEATPAATAYQLNPSGANITYPPQAADQSNWSTILYLGWRQSSWTVPGVTTVSGAVEIGEAVSTAGADAGLVWDYQLQATPAPVIAGTFVVATGSAAISYGATVALRAADYVTRTNATITPQMTQVWLKSIAAPYMNRTVTLIDWNESERTSRTMAYSIVGKYEPVAVTDLHSPRDISIHLWADNDAEIAAVDLMLSVGNILLVHIPPNVALKSFYAAVGSSLTPRYSYVRPAHLSHRATFTIALTEVGQPDLSIVGNLVTWATLLTNYGTWSDVITNNATWGTVAALLGTPADSLVGR